ncbi:hypothetical protein [Muribaculum intestinale]|jgi:hypothetical protein|uniref:hypothetical protein n=1 Tax=Muribaculum intestinale TaxID=1796646 RepID=UPI0013E8E86C|nr:hypothetical protein [Muribaculum intestinale]
MSKIDSSYTTLAATFIIKQALNADEDDIHGAMPDIAVPASMALDKALSLIKRK